jgi:predicted transcriptional regulator
MNRVTEEMLELMHYGMPRRSGRYPWGSGDDPYQHNRDFLGRIEELKKTGWTETPENIMKEFGLTTGQYRTEKQIANSERRMLDVARAKSLKEDGLGATEIGRKMGIPESTVRSLLNEKSESRMNQARKTADFIKEQVDKKGMIDVGTGVERELNISKERLNAALYLLEREGYPVYGGRFDQVTNKGAKTTQKVICPPGTEHKDIYNLDQVHSLNDYISRDGGETFTTFQYPKSMDSKRMMVRYAEEGGIDKDGIVEIRRGVPDLSLGNDHYAQVRILVDDSKYIKGMAVYSDNMPDGVDVVFNTNKKAGTPKLDVLKDIKSDPDNPFGALIKAGGQSTYTDKDGNEQLSLINKTRGEGDWTEWKDALPSQFLAKQSYSLAKKQLNLAKVDKQAEFDEICSLTNPTVKKHLLQKFSDTCDSAAVHLQAAALPGQKYHVIIPINSLKDNEVYAPGYKDGSELALIRYPHGGTFEIPILKVNNKNPVGKEVIGTEAIDAIGITKKVADRLSGADFDGDTVMCIPTNDPGGKVRITSTNPLPGLEGFDPKDKYGPDSYAGRMIKYMKDPVTGKDNTQQQMGVISNLITDMTLNGGATREELARAVRHSMVVIDAAKHKLDYKQSELDNNIAALKQKYQPKFDEDGNPTGKGGGASTIISKAKSETSVIKRQGTPKVNMKGAAWYDPTKPEGALIYKTADDAAYEVTRVNKRTGKVTTTTKYRHEQSTKMAETDDATTLVSEARHPMEMLYADYANSMKSLANRARVEQVKTGKIAYSSSAKVTYQNEVDSLMSKLNTALLNSARERAAQRKANAEIDNKKKAYEEQHGSKMKPGDVKKASQQALTKYRNEVGAIPRRDRSINITDREWEAIQAGAISESTLKKILNNTDVDVLRQRATPRATNTLSTAKVNKIKSMSASNYSLAEIANSLGVSTSTVAKYLKGVN